MRWNERGEAAAKQLLSQHQSFLKVHVDVRALAQHMGIRVVEMALDENTSGMLVRKGEVVSIAVNEQHHRNRKRFTIAHELGHQQLHLHARGGQEAYFIDRLVVMLRDERASEGTQQEEVEANAFAAALLMPEQLIRRALPGSLPGMQAVANAWDLSEERVRQLARQFRVSQQAMSFRLLNLGIIQASF